jgi:hypothetical protein
VQALSPATAVAAATLKKGLAAAGKALLLVKPGELMLCLLGIGRFKGRLVTAP